MHKWACVCLLLLGLGGCTVGPNYKRPAMHLPDQYYPPAPIQPASIADLPWWDLFKDPELQALIKEALKNNYDVMIAAARVEQARAQAGIARSEYFPQVGYGASVSGERAPLIANHVYYGYNFNLSWEIDLWGRVRRLNEQQRALFFSSKDVQRGVWISLVSDVAQAYFELRALDDQVDIARETGEGFHQTLDLFSKRFNGGAASGLETSRAEAAWANVVAQIPDLERQITAKEAEISLLLGRNPGPIPRGQSLTDQYDLDVIPSGLPSTLLERRPDLRAAEQVLVAANAGVGIAKANFFPVISLTGLLGGISPQLSGLVSSGTQWSVAGSLAGPLFTAGRLKNQYRFSIAQWEEARASYEQSVTQAFGEVSAALAAHQQLAESIKDQTRSVTAYQESVKLANIRYESGLSSYLEVVDAQLQMYPAQTALVIYNLDRKVALVNLYKALGGGWNLADTDWSRPGVHN